MPGHGVQPSGFLLVKHRLDPRGRLTGVLLGAGIYAERPTVGVELVDVNHTQAGRGQCPGGGQQGEIREMLVIDRVVLPPLDQAEQVRELQRHHARVLDQGAEALGEAPDVRNMREDVVRCNQVGSPTQLGDLVARPGGQELDLRRDAPRAGSLGDVCCGLDAKDRDPPGGKVLQEVAVVACHLGDQAARGQAEPADHRIRVPLRMLHPRVGVRREVRIVGEDVLTGHVGRKLHKQA